MLSSLSTFALTSVVVITSLHFASTMTDVRFVLVSLEKRILAENRIRPERELGGLIHSSPIYANGVLYIANQEMLYAIQEK